MHDTEFFKKLVENIVMWSFVIVIAALALTILGLPLYLALTVDWKFNGLSDANPFKTNRS